MLRTYWNHGWFEPFLLEEAIIGEPYTDVNGNGVYDNGIDIFRRSSDPSINQDLNYNGKHDGPENMSSCAWESAIPFDDLDGNGVCRCRNFANPTPDCAYAPFVDWNGNGAWDTASQEGTKLVKWSVEEDLYAWRAALYWQLDSVYHFVSDSGKEYWFDPVFIGPGIRMTRTNYSWTITQSSIPFPIFDTVVIEPIEEDTIRITSGGCTDCAFLRHIEVGIDLVIGDTSYSDLIHVRFDSMLAESRHYPDFLHWRWDFYFAKEIGLIAFEWRYEVDGRIEEWLFSFADKFDGTLPLPLTKVDRPQ